MHARPLTAAPQPHARRAHARALNARPRIRTRAHRSMARSMLVCRHGHRLTDHHSTHGASYITYLVSYTMHSNPIGASSIKLHSTEWRGNEGLGGRGWGGVCGGRHLDALHLRQRGGGRLVVPLRLRARASARRTRRTMSVSVCLSVCLPACLPAPLSVCLLSSSLSPYSLPTSLSRFISPFSRIISPFSLIISPLTCYLSGSASRRAAAAHTAACWPDRLPSACAKSLTPSLLPPFFHAHTHNA